MKPNRFSGLADPKPRTPSHVPLGGYLGYFDSGFVVLGFPLVFFRDIIEREFQKCEAQPAFLYRPTARDR